MNENIKKNEIPENQLESVAGGRGADEFNYFGSPSAQADTVPTMPPLLMHPASRLEEEKNVNIADRL